MNVRVRVRVTATTTTTTTTTKYLHVLECLPLSLDRLGVGPRIVEHDAVEVRDAAHLVRVRVRVRVRVGVRVRVRVSVRVRVRVRVDAAHVERLHVLSASLGGEVTRRLPATHAVGEDRAADEEVIARHAWAQGVITR